MDNHEGTISLCMIVRDESDNLGRCLESVRGFVNEIIVVDTGSRDATPDIARRYGAQVYEFPWQDNFSQARNESLRHAVGEWVLILDADEELPPETAHKLRRLASGNDVEAWAFTIISPCSSSQAGQQVKHPGLRMFKNREAYFFEGKIHEQIVPSILRANPGAAIPHADAVIMHHGYGQEIRQRREKTQRNISILKQALAEKPADAFINYNLGLSYHALSDLESSRQHYEAARPLIHPNDRFAAAFFRNYAICLGDLGDYEQALKLADEGLACFPDYPDLYFIKGQLCCDLNLLPLARANFLKCLRFRQTLPEYITTEGVTDRLALQNLAEVCARQQNFDEAATYLEQVLRISPTDELFAQICVLLQKKGLDGGGAAAYLEENFHLDPPAIARLLFDMKDYEACLHYLRGKRQGAMGELPISHELPGGNPAISGDELLLHVKCLLRLGRCTEAAKLLMPCHQCYPEATELLEQHCLALWLQYPRQGACALIDACDDPDDPSAITCREINSLLFSWSADAPGDDPAGSVVPLPHIRRPGTAPGATEPEPAVIERILHLALEALLDGDDDLSLTASLAGCVSNKSGDAYFVLGKHALSAGYSQEALQLLESARRVPGGRSSADICYLLGTACANLNRYDQAFLHFTEAGVQDPGNELYAACALEQLASQCLVHLTKMLGLEDGRTELQKELFRVTSLRHKMQRLKQDLLRREQREDVDTTTVQACYSFDANGTPESEVEYRRLEAAIGSMESRDTSPCGSPTQSPDTHLSGLQADLLSIVMPVWTDPEVTQKALHAIVDCTDCPYEIIIVDNGSDQICKAIFAEFESRHQGITRVICNDRNRGYPTACNQGLQISQGEYVVVMNNDVLVTPHWSSRMIAAFSSDPQIGIVGPRTNYVFSEQLVNECHYNEHTLNEWSQQWYERYAGSRQSTSRLIGFLMMIRQELIEQIGGFDPIFGPGNFEDDDYCLRARLAGYQLLIANDVFVHHFGSMSFNKQPEAFSQLLEANKRLFDGKWGLQSDAGRELLLSRTYDKNKLYIALG